MVRRGAVSFLLVLALGACGPDDASSRDSAGEEGPPPPGYVGRESCAACHPYEHERWRGSHHDLAMQEATDETVLGDFGGATLTHFGVTSRFFRRDGGFFVTTEGPDGKLHDYEVRYAFGFTPLQQYLVEFPGGRFQTLPLCWDARPEEQGGQRWFHIYPDERIAPDDVLFWTGPNQNWNYMCAECHSTNLVKGYDAAEDRYETTWAEIDVSCEACHGPGSEHLEWLERISGLAERPAEAAKLSRLAGERDGRMHMAGLRSPRQIEMCGRCHARRTVLDEDYEHGRPFGDTHRLSLLEERLYFADGQILEEVYVYGSFLQSRMYHEGVVCTDCHDPHSVRTLAEGNDLCCRCHEPDRYDTEKHHFHPPEGGGDLCVECHMPERTYMVVDPRRDHSIRIPRPDLSLALGTPNACNRCHDDKSVKWSEDHVAKWYGAKRRTPVHFGQALALGRSGGPGADAALVRLVLADDQPAIARATALRLLRRYPGPMTYRTVVKALDDESDLVRAAALDALEVYDPESRRVAFALLEDPVRAVRVGAARTLASLPERRMTKLELRAYERAFQEYVESEMANSDRGASHSNLGNVYRERRRLAQAEESFRTAIRIEPSFYHAYVNLADLYRELEREDEGERILRAGLERTPGAAALHHALGLLLVRTKRLEEAIDELGRAAVLDPDDPRNGYVYGVALSSAGRPEEAIEALRAVHERHPFHQDALFALATMQRDRGDLDAALGYARELAALAPANPAVRQLLETLDGTKRRSPR